MHVRVLYFAAAREAAGRREEMLELPEGATVEGLLNEVVDRHPALAALRGVLRVAVNEGYSEPHRRLQGGEEVALIPPVAGGAPLRREAATPAPRRRSGRPAGRGRRSGVEG